MKKMTLAMFIVVLIISTSMPALADDPSVPNVIMDVVLVRPAGLAAMVVGGAAYIVTLPFAATSRTVKPVSRTLLAGPFKFTFERPVGDFSSMEP